MLDDFSMKDYKWLITISIIDDFKQIEIHSVKQNHVLELSVKFSLNSIRTQITNLSNMIETEGGEAVVPDFIDFFLYWTS